MVSPRLQSSRPQECRLWRQRQVGEQLELDTPDDMGAIFKAVLAELIAAGDVRLTIARLDRDQRDLLRRALASVQDIDIPAIEAPATQPGAGSTAVVAVKAPPRPTPSASSRPPDRRGGSTTMAFFFRGWPFRAASWRPSSYRRLRRPWWSLRPKTTKSRPASYRSPALLARPVPRRLLQPQRRRWRARHQLHRLLPLGTRPCPGFGGPTRQAAARFFSSGGPCQGGADQAGGHGPAPLTAKPLRWSASSGRANEVPFYARSWFTTSTR